MTIRPRRCLIELANATFLMASGLCLAGCGDADKQPDGTSLAEGGQPGNPDGSTAGAREDPGGTPIEGDGATDFISHVVGSSSSNGEAELAIDDDSGGETSALPAMADTNAGAFGDGSDASRAITEADILKVEGNALYALSRYSGLTIIDLSNPTDLRVIGSHRSSATPFEMYLEGGTAYIMYNDFYHREWDDEAGYYRWQLSSRMQALDLSNPASPKVLGYKDLPGSISDSRKVGDIVYVVTHQDAYCWDCDTVANTRISSFDVSDPSSFNPVDQERFESEDESWGPRHVSVSQNRMYVSGYIWSSDGSPEAGSIQVVDISDPNGQIESGAIVEVAGQIDNRWQMDEFEGVLRVISQPSTWTTTSVPVVETFAIASSTSLNPLARLPMVLPRQEALQSVRFDGERAFAVTFEQTDPLFTFDMSNPENPVQVGEVEIPGFLYHMEPRGDRLYALGFDNGVDDGALHVSIFDVSNLAEPRMLDRVNFGGDWGWFSEDQDRIHKLFNLSLDDELILLPFSGSAYNEETCYYDWGSGIQLIDAQGDDLTLRGVAPQVGEARRALLHDGVLLGISDNAVQAFDISDRDNPTRIDRLDVARNVSQVKVLGDDLLRFGQNWWTGEVELDLVALAEAEAAESDTMLDLTPLAGVREQSCSEENGGYFYSSTYFTGQVFVHGDYAFVPREVYESGSSNSSADWYSRNTMRLTIVALSGDGAPRIAGEIPLEPTGYDNAQTESSYYAGFLQTDSALLVGRRLGSYYYDSTTGERSETSFAYDVIDLSAGADARVASRLEVPDSMAVGGWGYGAYGCMIDMAWGWYGYDSGVAVVSGDIVASQHEEAVDDGTGRVRYYLDRIDVSDPAAPTLLGPVNIPGKVLHYEHSRKTLVTVEEVPETIEGITESEPCYDYGRGAQWQYDQDALVASNYDHDNTPGTCVRRHRRLSSLVLEGDLARRVSLLELDPNDADGTSRATQNIAVSNSRIFYQSFTYGDDSRSYVDGKVVALGYAPDGKLSALGSVPMTAEYWNGMVARDKRAFISNYGTMEVVTSKSEQEPTSADYDLRSWYCDTSALEVVGDRVYCAGYEYGVQRIELE